MKHTIAIFVLLLAAGSTWAQGEEQPNEKYWHLVSDSGVPENYLIYAGLTADERAKVLPVLAEYEAKYQALRKSYNDLSGEEQVNGEQAKFLVSKDALAKEYDARLTGLLSALSVLGIQRRIAEVAHNTTVTAMGTSGSVVTLVKYHLHADMGNCHPSFHYSSYYAFAIVPDPTQWPSGGTVTITETASGYTYVPSNTCSATHQGHVKTALDTQAPNEQWTYAAATAHMSVSVSSTRAIGNVNSDPIFSTGINFWFAGSVNCPTFGAIVPWNWVEQGMILEPAVSRVSWNPSSHATSPYCTPISSPPDYRGPLNVPASWTDPHTGQGPAGFQDWESIGVKVLGSAWQFPLTINGASGRNVPGVYPPVVPDCTNSSAGVFPPTFPY